MSDSIKTHVDNGIPNPKRRKGLRTYRLKDFLNERFPYTVRKMPLHSNLGCPHRDRHSETGGCIFCYEPGFSSTHFRQKNISEQIESTLAYARKKGYQGKFMAYFQTGTNTYAPSDVLESLWKPILEYPDQIVAMAIGTRPDCISQATLELLQEMSQHLLVWLELGLQSVHNDSLIRINRGHDYTCFENMVQSLRPIPNLFVCAHIILGLPGETKKDMLTTIERLNTLGIDGVKIHHLQVPRHTVLETQYLNGEISIFTIAEYVDLITDLIPHLSGHMVIHRLTGEIRDDLLCAPRWPLAKVRVVQMIEEALKKKKVYQGDYSKTIR